MNMQSESLCWACKNAVPCGGDGCSWSRRFVPIKNWTAEEKNYPCRTREVQTYLVIDCPEYVHG